LRLHATASGALYPIGIGAANGVAKDGVAKDGVAKDSVAKDSVAKDSPAAAMKSCHRARPRPMAMLSRRRRRNVEHHQPPVKKGGAGVDEPIQPMTLGNVRDQNVN
jgi:hypothetical protein